MSSNEKIEIFFSICLKTIDLKEKIIFTNEEILKEDLLYQKNIKKGSENYTLLIYYINLEIEKEKEKEKEKNLYKIQFKITFCR